MPTRNKAPLLSLSLIAFIIFFSGCQTLPPDAAETKEKALLETQKSLIVSLINKGSPEIAIKELRKLEQVYPEDADFPNLTGLCYLSLRDPNEAAKNFKNAYRLKPSAHIALNLGSAYIEQKKYKDAIDLLVKLKGLESTKTYANPERIHHNIGFAYENLRDYKNAEMNYLTALRINPNYYLTLMRLGQIYERTNKKLQAIETFERARRVCQVCFDPINGLFHNYKVTGKPAEGEAALRSYIAQSTINPVDRSRAQKLLEKYSSAAKNRRSL
ncbi:MAG: tetratricopeptide repeat protein [Oligoflexales bacterium]